VTQLGLFEHAPPPAPATAPSAPIIKAKRFPAPREIGNWMFRLEGRDRQGRSHFTFLVRHDMHFDAACADAAATALRCLGFSAVDEIVVLL
jgi:hypothetical protein